MGRFTTQDRGGACFLIILCVHLIASQSFSPQEHAKSSACPVLLRDLLSFRKIDIRPGCGTGIIHKNGHFRLPGVSTKWIGVKFGSDPGMCTPPTQRTFIHAFVFFFICHRRGLTIAAACPTTGNSKKENGIFSWANKPRVTGLRNGCGDPVNNSQDAPEEIWGHYASLTPELLMALSAVPHFTTPEVFDSAPEKRKHAYIGNALSDIGGVNFATCVLHVSPARPALFVYYF